MLLHGVTMLWAAKMLSSLAETPVILQKHKSFIDGMYRQGFMHIFP